MNGAASGLASTGTVTLPSTYAPCTRSTSSHSARPGTTYFDVPRRSTYSSVVLSARVRPAVGAVPPHVGRAQGGVEAQVRLGVDAAWQAESLQKDRGHEQRRATHLRVREHVATS